MPITFGRVFSFLKKRRGARGGLWGYDRGMVGVWEFSWGGIYDWIMLGYGINCLFLFGLNWSSYSNPTITALYSLFHHRSPPLLVYHSRSVSLIHCKRCAIKTQYR
jgi:hypothetical protein